VRGCSPPDWRGNETRTKTIKAIRTNGDVTTTAPLWADLVDGLAEQGVLSEQWRAAFLAVPREVFIPEVIWRYAGDDLVALRRSDEPQEWLRRVYESVPLRGRPG